MEKNTVILDIVRYNDLYDFKKDMADNHTIVINSVWNNGYMQSQNTKVYTTDEIVKEIGERNEEYKKENDDLRKEIFNLKHPKNKELSISEIKRMNWWKFRKWKNKWL